MMGDLYYKLSQSVAQLKGVASIVRAARGHVAVK